MFNDLAFTPPADLDTLVDTAIARGRQRIRRRRARMVATGALALVATVAVAAASLAGTTRNRAPVAEHSGGTNTALAPGSGRGNAQTQNSSKRGDSSSAGRPTHRRPKGQLAAPNAPVVHDIGIPHTKLAFSSDVDDGLNDVYVYDGLTHRITRLTSTPVVDTWPTWSPDATRIAFYSQRDNGRSVIYVMNSDGSNQHAITPMEPDAESTQPAWSPDGNWIAYTHYQGVPNTSVATTVALALVAPDGTNRHDLPVSGAWAAWSPDSRVIAYVNATGDLDVLDLTTMQSRTLVPGGANTAERPAFAPDGRRIAFDYIVNNVAQIYTVASDGTDMRQLFSSETDELWPTWSPDGTELVFNHATHGHDGVACFHLPDPRGCTVNLFGGPGDLWSVNADGTRLRPFIESFGNIGLPQFVQHLVR